MPRRSARQVSPGLQGSAGGESGLVGATLGASVDADAPSAAQSVAAGLLDELPDRSSAPHALAIEHLWTTPLRDAVPTKVAWRSGTAP